MAPVPAGGGQGREIYLGPLVRSTQATPPRDRALVGGEGFLLSTELAPAVHTIRSCDVHTVAFPRWSLPSPPAPPHPRGG